jgi:hypothetical protein
VIRVRTNVRGEDDYLYRIRMPVEDIRALFLSYIGQANSLVKQPRFYNTITVNCTTLVYQMMQHIVGYLPMDYRLLLSGYIPGVRLSRRGSRQSILAGGIAGTRTYHRAREAGRSQRLILGGYSRWVSPPLPICRALTASNFSPKPAPLTDPAPQLPPPMRRGRRYS